MATFRDTVIVALLRRMGGPQYLEYDELDGIERPQFIEDGEYLVVRRSSPTEDGRSTCPDSNEKVAEKSGDASLPPSP